jgi:hypothetical protein
MNEVVELALQKNKVRDGINMQDFLQENKK